MSCKIWKKTGYEKADKPFGNNGSPCNASSSSGTATTSTGSGTCGGKGLALYIKSV